MQIYDIDVPLSLAADTVLLPYTIPRTILAERQERREMEQQRERQQRQDQERREHAQRVQQAPPSSVIVPETPFDGYWTATFAFEKNTGNTEPRHPWVTFEWDVRNISNTVTGAMRSDRIGGTLRGTSQRDQLKGTMRLGWDQHDWDSLTLQLDADLRSGSGNAVFGASDTEKHYYSIQLKRRDPR